MPPTFPQLTYGKKYRIIHKSPSQRYRRLSIMRFLGPSDLTTDALVFDARPLAGTQTMPREWIIGICEVPQRSTIVLNERGE